MGDGISGTISHGKLSLYWSNIHSELQIRGGT